MKYTLSRNTRPEEPKTTEADKLHIGEIAEVLTGTYAKEILMRILNDQIISLTNPDHVWTGPCSMTVRPIPTGDSITLTIQ